jgi:ribokinase
MAEVSWAGACRSTRVAGMRGSVVQSAMLPPHGQVLVLGNAGIDLSIPVRRLPQPGETLVGGALRRAPGGKGLNQAVMAARTGMEVQFCAPLGDDADGRYVEDRLRAEPFAALRLPRPGPPTDVSVLLVAADSENCIVTSGACADALPVAEAEGFAAGCRPGDVLLLQGNLSQAATVAPARMGRLGGARVLLNTAPLRWPLQPVLAECWGVVANAVEAREITGQQGDEAAAGLAALGPRLAVVTLGAGGCVAAPGGHSPAPASQPVDSTGAGDAFCGVLASALARGLEPQDAITAAQRAAAQTVRRRGAFEALPARFDLVG